MRQLPNGKWQVRWREADGRQPSKSFDRKTDAQRFHAEKRGEARIAKAQRSFDQLHEAREASVTADDSLWADMLQGAEGFDPAVFAGFRVYLLWAAKGDERPLYVGSSVRVLGRLGDHLQDGSKRAGVGWITLIRCDSAESMLAREYALIRKFRPPWNTFIPYEAPSAEEAR